MSGIVGSRLNHRGSGVVGALGTDGQLLTSAGAGKSAVYEAAPAGFDVSTITGATALAATPATTDELILSDGGVLKRMDYTHIKGIQKNWFWLRTSDPQNAAQDTLTKVNFNHTLSGTDPDSLVSSATWTCPSDGDYFFWFNVALNNSSNVQQLTAYPKLNDTAITHAYAVSMVGQEVQNQTSLSFQHIHNALSAGDTYDVFVYCHASGHSNATSIKITGTNFGGWKIS